MKEIVYREIGKAVFEAFVEERVPIKLELNRIYEKILSEISAVLADNDTDDFMKIEDIVCIMEKYGLETGGCHDF